MEKRSHKKSHSTVNESANVLRVNLISLFLVLFGILAIVFFVYWRINQYYLSFLNVPVAQADQTSYAATAKNLLIPSLDLKLTVDESVIKNGKWGVSSSGVSHLVGSANPGDLGTIIIYGHNKQSILGKIKNLKRGDTVNLETVDGKTHGYRVLTNLVVSPKDTWVLQDNGIEKLVIYTCTGFFDMERLVVVAEPV